jgi:3-oxoadipate enol-lactonase
MIGAPSIHEHADGQQTWFRHFADGAGVKPPVALLHGWTLCADEQWHRLYPRLSEHRAFIAIDHPGHGRSDPPAGPFTLTDAADRAADVLRATTDEPVVLAGFSLGGPVALHVAARHPELVAALVLVSTTHQFAASKLTQATMPLVETFIRSRLGDRIRSAQARRLSLHSSITAARRQLDPTTVTSAAQCLDGLDLASLCSQITIPAVSIVTTADRMITPDRQRRLAAALRASIIELDGPHTVYESNPTAFAATVTSGIAQACALVAAS